MPTFRLTLLNHSGASGTFVVYQRSEKVLLQPLAWLSQFSYPGTSVQMQWNPRDWGFVWAALTQIQPGTVFTAAQLTAASPDQGNQIDFTASEAGAFEFTNQKDGAVPGYFTLIETASVPLHGAALGLAMSGKPTFATLARPNSRILFGSQISYWVTFGDFAEGEFLFDLATLPSARIDFPPGVADMVARLNADFSWTVGEAAAAGVEVATETAPS